MQWSELTAFYRHGPTERVVLVTMVEKQGSSYRQPGARMLVRADGASCGTVSAGCLEDEIIRAAGPVQHDGQARLLTIDTRPHYGCPGKITLLLEALAPADAHGLFSLVEQQLAARRPFTVVTAYGQLDTPGPFTRAYLDEASAGPPASAGDRILRQLVGRQPRLVIVGAGDDATAMAKAALLAQWDVCRVSPDEVQFAPAQLVARFAPDDRTAVVLMTHNLGHDVACLSEILPRSYSYVGVIGSARRRSELIHGLESAGAHDALDALDRLCCPAGLDLGAGEAGEIAISILAEIQCGWSGRDASPLRARGQPIHAHGGNA